MLTILFYLSNAMFAFLLFYFLYLTIRGLFAKLNRKPNEPLDYYPTVDIFIPAHNEGIVMADTLTAMSKLKYPGELNVYLLNDNSKDNTAEIGDEFSRIFHHIHHIRVPAGTPRGKSRVLNYGLSISNGEYFVGYDADNQPESDAVQLLMEAVMKNDRAVGAVGTVRTVNADTNLLTRMIALEFQVFQLGLQVGRWKAHKVGSLPGTNMMLKREIIEAQGGYDEYALAEDAELTVRLAAEGHLLAVEPFSYTWEQEPETLRTLVRQRTRWLQGNLYLMIKFIMTPSWWLGKGFVHLFYYLSIYIIFPFLLLFSNILFVLGLLGWVNIESNIPFTFIWFLAYFLYTGQILLAQWFDGTLTVKNFLVSLIMYFTYAQMFVFLLATGVFGILKQMRGEVVWAKTERVQNPKDKQ
ncbi:MAG: glycosyltransferase family 2 protein [Bacilli bacterium]